MGGGQQSKLLDVQAVQNLSFLEEGSFAKIYKGYVWTPRRGVSIKVPKVPEQMRKDRKLVKAHVDEVRKLWPGLGRATSDYVVQYLGVAYDDLRKEVWVVKEFVDGVDLESVMRTPSLCPLLQSPEKKMMVAVGVARGLSHLHGLKWPLIHGQLRPSDVLVSADTLQPRITNFGLWDFKRFFMLQLLQDSGAEHHLDPVNPYQAPEVVLSQERPSFFSDAWSLAATLLHWLYEVPPWDFQDLCIRFRNRQHRQLLALQQAMLEQDLPSVVAKVEHDPDAVPLTAAFHYQPTDRPAVARIEQHLVRLSLTPSWTNVAFQKYYGPSRLT